VIRNLTVKQNAERSFNGILRSMANKLPPTPRKQPKVKKSRAPHSIHSDELILTILRRIKGGEKIPKLAVEFDIKASVIIKWAQGFNRGHLLMQVEREFRDVVAPG
jgi:hypothetical protein